MKNRVCCCFGHREVLEDLSLRLQRVVEELIVQENVSIFYTGGMGQTDERFASAVRQMKGRYSQVELILVRPYFAEELNRNKQYYQENYDSILIPSETAGLYYKGAIRAGNRWMVDRSDYVVSYVLRRFGGAYDAVEYARRKGKVILDIAR